MDYYYNLKYFYVELIYCLIIVELAPKGLSIYNTAVYNKINQAELFDLLIMVIHASLINNVLAGHLTGIWKIKNCKI